MDHQRARFALYGVLFLTFLDTTIVSTSLAGIQGEFQTSVSTLQWVVNSYTLPFAALMLLGGSLGDLYGRRRLMQIGVVLFALGSLLAATAGSASALLLGRSVMGIGAAAAEPSTLSLLRQLYPDHHARARALGGWTAVSGIALALGPVVGSLLLALGGWRAVFWFNLVYALLVLPAVFLVPESRDNRRLDLPGGFLGVAALSACVYATIAGEDAGYSSWWVLLLFLLAAVLGVLFVLVERRAEDPLLDLSTLRRPSYASAVVVAFLAFFSMFAVFFFTALYLQVVVGQTPLSTALTFLPLMLALVLSSLLTGRWVAARGPRSPMTLGCLTAALGLAGTALLSSLHPSELLLSLVLALAGAGFGAAVVPVTAAALSSAPPERSGMAAATTNTARALGSVVGVAALGSLLVSHVTSDLESRLRSAGVSSSLQSFVANAITHGGVSFNGSSQGNSTLDTVIHAAYEAFVSGLHLVLWVGAILLALGAALALRYQPRGSGEGPQPCEEPCEDAHAEEPLLGPP